jgi:hypothetical protein
VEIVAVCLYDVKAMGVDRFYVRFGPDQVHTFDAFTDGRVVQLTPEPLPERAVTASIEKFNASFRLVPPLVIADVSELTKFLDAFEPIDDTHCRRKV